MSAFARRTTTACAWVVSTLPATPASNALVRLLQLQRGERQPVGREGDGALGGAQVEQRPAGPPARPAASRRAGGVSARRAGRLLRARRWRRNPSNIGSGTPNMHGVAAERSRSDCLPGVRPPTRKPSAGQYSCADGAEAPAGHLGPPRSAVTSGRCSSAKATAESGASGTSTGVRRRGNRPARSASRAAGSGRGARSSRARPSWLRAVEQLGLHGARVHLVAGQVDGRRDAGGLELPGLGQEVGGDGAVGLARRDDLSACEHPQVRQPGRRAGQCCRWAARRGRPPPNRTPP